MRLRSNWKMSLTGDPVTAPASARWSVVSRSVCAGAAPGPPQAICHVRWIETLIRCASINGLPGLWLVCALACSLFSSLSCAGPKRLYPTSGSQLVGPSCSSLVAARKPQVVVELASGKRLEGRLVHVECNPETSIVLDFRHKRGMFRIAGEPDSVELPLREIRSMSSLETRIGTFGIAMGVAFVGVVVLALTLPPLIPTD